MIELIVNLLLLAVLFYLIGMIPMGEPFPQILRVVAIIIAVAMVLSALGIHILGDFDVRFIRLG